MNYARHQTGLGSEVNARAETKVMHGFPFWRRSGRIWQRCTTGEDGAKERELSRWEQVRESGKYRWATSGENYSATCTCFESDVANVRVFLVRVFGVEVGLALIYDDLFCEIWGSFHICSLLQSLSLYLYFYLSPFLFLSVFLCFSIFVFLKPSTTITREIYCNFQV